MWRTVWVMLAFASRAMSRDLGPDADLSSFNSIDTNDDGKISKPELMNTGLPQCLMDLIAMSFNDITVDSDDDDLLSELEWYNFISSRLGRLISVREVVDWLTYAVQKPQYAQTFREHYVSGHDFVDLVRDGGRLLSEELGITKDAARSQIRRSMIMRLCSTGVGAPDIPQNLTLEDTEDGVSISWDEPAGNGAPIVHYQVQRASLRSHFTDIADHHQTDTHIHDHIHQSGQFQYRVQAWNGLGRSGWSEVGKVFHTEVTPPLWQRLSAAMEWPSLLILLIAACMMAVTRRPAAARAEDVSPVYEDEGFGETQGTGMLSTRNLEKCARNFAAAASKPFGRTLTPSEQSFNDAMQRAPAIPRSPSRNSITSNASSATRRRLLKPVKVTAVGLDAAIRVTWDFDAEARDIAYVNIRLRCDSTNEDRVTRVEGVATRSTVVKGLENGEVYHVRVMAHLDESKFSSSAMIETMPLPDQRKNMAGTCNWCRTRLQWRGGHTCRNCDASFCKEHGSTNRCLTPFFPCISCECLYCIRKSNNR